MYCRIVRVGGCLAVVAQWQSTGGSSQVSWVWFSVAAGVFHFSLFMPHNIQIHLLLTEYDDPQTGVTLIGIVIREKSTYLFIAKSSTTATFHAQTFSTDANSVFKSLVNHTKELAVNILYSAIHEVDSFYCFAAFLALSLALILYVPVKL